MMIQASSIRSVAERGEPDMPIESRRTNGKTRIAWVDYAKGFCIIMVVMMRSTLGVGNALGGQGFLHAVVAFAAGDVAAPRVRQKRRVADLLGLVRAGRVARRCCAWRRKRIHL